jgi:fimbrial chaperone protein
MRYGLVGGFALALAWMPVAALAGSFNVMPVKLFFNDPGAAKVLRITNDGTGTIPVQVIAKRWSQDAGGAPVYEDTDDLVFFPALLELNPGQQRLVRVGYQGPAAGAAERTYRLFLEEIPSAEGVTRGLNMTLRLGVPVFVAPTRDLEEAVIDGPSLAGGVLTVPVANRGNRHVVVGRITATGRDGEGTARFTQTGRGWYVLPGVRRGFTLEVPADACAGSREIEIEVDASGRDLTARLAVDAADCVAAP